MPVVTDPPVFTTAHATVLGLAAPSRGSSENSVFRITMHPGAPAFEHSVSREEIFVALSGRAVATVGGTAADFSTGDTLIVPADTLFSITTSGDEPLELIAILPVGGQAAAPGAEPMTPPWAQ
jgi:mannose-6-phosphate isomerase-like protein (cupin superfamily)